MTLEEEKDLLDNIRENPGAFGVLFDLYYRGIFGYILRRTADYDLARDIASETFLKAFTGLHRFRPRGISISFWLYRIATNEVNAHYRKLPFLPSSLNSLSTQVLDDALQIDSEEEKEALEREIALHEEYVAVIRELKKLPTRYQAALSLRYFENKSIRDIGEILGKSEGTVKSLLFRGVEKLKQRLASGSNPNPLSQSEVRYEN